LIIACLPLTIHTQQEGTMSTDETTYSMQQAQEKLAKMYFNSVWDLLEKTDRTPEDDEAMIHAAHASCYLWMQVGTPVNHQRGEWQVARVYTILGHYAAALRHANCCLELTDKHPELMQDFDIAFAYECVARANAIAGNRQVATKYIELAEQAGQDIKDPDDRKVFFDNFNSGLWNGMK